MFFSCLRFWQCLAILLLLTSQSGIAAGQEQNQASFSQHYDTARRLYSQKDYAGAAHEFRAAYEIRHDPRLLLNLGNAYLMLGDPSEALRIYDRCAAHDPPLDEESKGALASARAAAQKKLQPALTQTPPPPPPVQPEKKPAYKSPWLWGTLSAVVLAGAATGLAIALTRPGDPFANVPPMNRFEF